MGLFKLMTLPLRMMMWPMAAPVRMDHDAFEDGVAFSNGNAAVREPDGNAVRGRHVRHVHRRAGRYVRAVFRDEKNAHGKDAKAWKNADAHAHSPAL